MSVFALSMRSLLLRPRTAGIAVLPLLVGVAAVLLAAVADDDERELVFGQVSGNLTLSLVVALVALVLGGNAFGDERDGGTLPLLLATSTPRWRIVLEKLLAGWLATWLVCLPAVVGCAVLGLATPELSSSEVLPSVLASSVLTAGGYCAAFVLLSLVSTRGLLIGLAYVVVWEGLLAGYTTALRNLSIGAYARRVVAAPFPNSDDLPFTVADLSTVGAALLLGGLVVVGGGLSMWRLPRLEVQ